MNLPLREPDEAQLDGPGVGLPPKVFVRVLVTPPGPPWEQARAARLDARHGSPLPIAELTHQVRRLDRWAPGRAGRYVAMYVHSRDALRPFETTVTVEGQTLDVRFGGGAPRVQGLPRAALWLGGLALIGAIFGGGVMLALEARRAATAQLEADEQLAATRLRLAQGVRDRANQARDLRALVGHGRPVGDVLADLTWVATGKGPEARIVAVHWERGLLAVEARGEQPPFLAADRPIERSPKPLRPGVWLWAIGRPGDLSGASGPVAAEMAP